MNTDFNTLETLREQDPAWRLLRADSVSLVTCLLHQAFLDPGDRLLGESELAGRLQGLLDEIDSDNEPRRFPRPPREYLTNWSADDQGWLRRFYREGSDEPHYEPTAAAEAAVRWIDGLERPGFVGTESRLKVLMGLLEQIYEGSQTDLAKRREALERKRDEIDAEIATLEAEGVEPLGDTQVRDRFMEVQRQAKQLLADFRAVEENFRDLDREIREKITRWEGGKGALLDEILGQRDAIAESEQGRSFRGFYDFLMDPDCRQLLEDRMAFVLELSAVAELRPDRRLRRIHHDWVRAGSHTQRTVAGLSARLRTFVDDAGWAEHRSIGDLLKKIEQHALALRGSPPDTEAFMRIDTAQASVRPPMERPLYRPVRRGQIDSSVKNADHVEEVSLAALGRLSETDRQRLEDNLDWLLAVRESVTLAEVVAVCPLREGLAELVGYLQIATAAAESEVNETKSETVAWTGPDGRARRATLPRVIFCRGQTS